MARHIMAVCVVCLLCAQRLHCQDHIAEMLATHRTEEKLNARLIYGNLSPSINERTTDQRHDTDEDDTQNYSTSPPYRRHKRHAGHDHDHEHGASPKMHVPQITQYYLQQIMQQQVLNASSFQSLLQQLGLQHLVSSNSSCVAAESLVHHVQPHHPGHHNEYVDVDKQTLLLTNCSLLANGSCAPLDSSLETEKQKQATYEVSEKDLLHLCPVLLHELTTSSGGCIEPAILSKINTYEMEQKDDIFYVWIYAFISVFACGILGLVGVAIIPFMGSRYYKHIIQYLVSLAVGTMTGDALLHLLPHSLAGQDEQGMIMKGLGCLSGIIFFYLTEHSLTMISEWRKSVEKKETKKPSRAKVMRDPDSSVNNSVAGDKMCKQKYSSYPYCYDEITMNNKQDVWMHLPDEGTSSAVTSAAAANGAGGDASSGECSNRRCDKTELEGSSEAAAQSLLSTSHNNYAEMNNHHHHNHNHSHNNHQQQQHHQDSSNTVTTELDTNPTTANGAKDKNDHVTVILREHESSHHGHSHRHGHVHSPPETLSAVAWMIIMGDGLHNFTDGMAIGAAFAENIAGGFSTSLAVFCHELPHELGDFAILMKAGMSVKSAVYYNLLTGVLSFIGMIFGIVFGQSQDVAQWMFAVAAGLFIYIALVDMMPEISAAHKSLAQFMLQIVGMLSGVVIMLLIAIYEGQLMNAFGTKPPSAAHHQHVH